MLHVMWEFHVKLECQQEFERHYRAYGSWAMLFRKSPFYDRTLLTRDSKIPTRYLVTDIWADLSSLESFKKNFREDYDVLDEECEQLTVSEKCMGHFELIEDKKPQLFRHTEDEDHPKLKSK